VLFGEAVQENDHRPVGRPGIDDVEHELTAAELFHRLSVSFGHAAVGTLAVHDRLTVACLQCCT
jgi:hypothetical protein